jgi:hypothetical protein
VFCIHLLLFVLVGIYLHANDFHDSKNLFLHSIELKWGFLFPKCDTNSATNECSIAFDHLMGLDSIPVKELLGDFDD